jgi:hypothetical protein
MDEDIPGTLLIELDSKQWIICSSLMALSLGIGPNFQPYLRMLDCRSLFILIDILSTKEPGNWQNLETAKARIYSQMETPLDRRHPAPFCGFREARSSSADI